jgi:putative ABC transport system permease protein
MQKVGMTKKEIRRSINSQMLTVFFLPLLMAGIHLGFAFPVISKMLILFAFNDTFLNAIVTICSFAVFGLLYTIVYKLTSGSYYAIVSGRKEQE